MDMITGEAFQVTSTHHQMIRPSPEGLVIVGAKEATQFERMDATHQRTVTVTDRHHKDVDVEAVSYPAHRVFCFQPHPEFRGQKELAERYQNYVEEYLFKGVA